MIVREENQGVDSWPRRVQGRVLADGCKRVVAEGGPALNRLLYDCYCFCSKFRPRAPRLFSKVHPAVSQQKPASGLRGRA